MSYNKIIIDVNNLFHRNYHIFKDQKVILKDENKTEVLTGGIYGFLRSLNKIERDYLAEEGEIYLCFDNPTSKDSSRKTIDPNYKLNRVKKDVSFYRGLDYLSMILLNHSTNYYTIQAPELEADDHVPALICSFNKYDKVLLVSNDLDWSRAIDNNVDWYDLKEVYKKENYKEKYGFYPSKDKIILYKTIRGDSSDEIEIGIKGIKEDILLRLIEDYKDIYDLLENINNIEYLSEKWKKEFIECKARLILNHQLIDYCNVCYDELKQFVFKASFNPITLRFYYKLLNLKISEIHPKLLNSFPEKEDIENSKNKDFFCFDKVERI